MSMGLCPTRASRAREPRYNERKISRHEERPVVTLRRQYDETNERHDLKTWNLRHTKKADNTLKNNFRSEEVFAGPWKVSIDFVHDLTSYHVLARLPAAVRQMSPRSDGRERRKSSLDTCGRRLSSKGRGKEQ